MAKEIPPFPPDFPDQLASYYEQATAAVKKHHDTRRHLFPNFLRESFNVDPLEVETGAKNQSWRGPRTHGPGKESWWKFAGHALVET